MALSHSPRIITDGLVLCLDAANPKSYPGSGTTWYDLSGNGNNATLLGNASYVTYNSNGYFEHTPGNAYYGATSSTTGGDSNYGAYWQISSDSSLNPSYGWTISGVMSVRSQSGNGGGWFVLGASDRKVHLEPINDVNFRANGSSGWDSLIYNIASYKNTFHYYTFRFTQTSGIYGTDFGSLSLYIDGNQVTTTSGYIPSATTNYQINLGRRMGHLYHFIDADIANYSYYNRSLSDQEIQQNFNATRGRYGI